MGMVWITVADNSCLGRPENDRVQVQRPSQSGLEAASEAHDLNTTPEGIVQGFGYDNFDLWSSFYP